MRDLAPAVKTALQQLRGVTVIRVVEIAWTTGTLRYSDRTLTAPVEASGDVVSWGEVQLSAEPGNVGGYGQVTLQLSDPEGTLSDKLKAAPLSKVRVRIFLHVDGLNWSDRVEVFRGFISTSSWLPTRGSWSISLKPIQEIYAVTLGTRITADVFPEITCRECDGKYIPIVFGRPVYRVPVCSVARPGNGVLARPFGPCDSRLELTTTAERLGFQSGVTINLVISAVGGSETVTGYFSGPDSTIFNVTYRSTWAAKGVTAGYAAEGGIVTVTIPMADVLPAYRENGLAGYPIIFIGKFSGCEIRLVTEWRVNTPSEGAVAVYMAGENEVFPGGGGQPYVIFNTSTPSWPAGAAVGEIGPSTYIANYLPSEAVERVEIRASAQSADGSTSAMLYYTFNTEGGYYSVNLNDKSFNTLLGRGATDPGVTSITVTKYPTEVGSPDGWIYVTIRGTTYSSSGGLGAALGPAGTAMEKPAHVLLELLTNPLLGGVSPSDVDADSFVDAAPFTVTRFAFAITDEKKLHDVVSQLAQQSGCLLFWDSRATISYIGNKPNKAYTNIVVRPETTMKGSVSLSDPDYTQKFNHLTLKVRLEVPGEEFSIIRKSQVHIDEFQKKEKSMDCWGFQASSSVAESGRIWLLYELRRGRTIELATFLNGLHLQPGDIAQVYTQIIGPDGLKKWVVNGELMRITNVTHAMGSPVAGVVDTVKIKGITFPWEYAISAEEPMRDCPQIQRIDRLPISDGNDGTTGEPGTIDPGSTGGASTTDPPFSFPPISTSPPSTNPDSTTNPPETEFMMCKWKSALVDGVLEWVQVTGGCPGGCNCMEPDWPPTFPNQWTVTSCEECTTTTTEPPTTTPGPTTTTTAGPTTTPHPTSFPNSSQPPPVPGPCFCGALNFFEVEGDPTLYYPVYDSLPGGGCYVEVSSIQLGTCFGNVRLECVDGGWTGTINVGGEIGEIPLDITVNSTDPYDITVTADGVCGSGTGHFWQYVPPPDP